MKEKLTVKEIQMEEVEILKKIQVFFLENNIKYFAFYGTFLGMIRHKGFIPWYDDIDLAIPRPDYDRLVNILKRNSKITDNVEAIGFEIGKSNWPFLKIINKNIVIEDKQKCDKYLWIDIFPLDGTVNSPFYYLKKNLLMKLFISKRSYIKKTNYYNTKNKNLINRVVGLMILPISLNYIITKYINICKKYDYNTSKIIGINMWENSQKNFLKEKMVSKEYKFENITLNGIEDYDYMLKKLYGEDYMQLPPKEKRVTHSFNAIKSGDINER